MCTRMAQVWVRTHSIHACVIWCVCLVVSLRHLHSLLLPHLLLRWTNHLCNSAEDLGTLAEKEPPTGYEPNEYHITEGFVDCTQESLVEQPSPNDFDYDDVTIGKALSDAYRRRADHSEEEGLSSCLSLSVSHDRTVRPVVKPFDSQISSVQEIPRHSSESEQ